MGILSLRTIAVSVIGLVLSIVAGLNISWWLTPIILIILSWMLVWLVILDVKAYAVHTIALIQNPRRILSDTGVLTSQLPFWLKPFGNRIVEKYANGDYNERLAAAKTRLKKKTTKQSQ